MTTTSNTRTPDLLDELNNTKAVVKEVNQLVSQIVEKLNSLLGGTAKDSVDKSKQALDNLQGLFKTFKEQEGALKAYLSSNGSGEITGLIEQGKLKKQQLEQAKAIFDPLQKAFNDGTLTSSEQIESFKQLELQIKTLEATVDPLAEKISSIFSKAMKDPLYEFIMGTKTAEEAFKTMAISIVNDLAKLALQEGLSQIFSSLGGSGSGGGFFGFLSGLFNFNAKGGVYKTPGISAYSNQVVNQPTFAAFAKGGAIFGEAGAEAIMPLTRTGSGELAVKAVQDIQNGPGNTFTTGINVNITGGQTTTTTNTDHSNRNSLALAQVIDQAIRERLSREIKQGGLIWQIRNGAY